MDERGIAQIAGFTSDHAVVAGVRLHYWSGGDRDGRPVLLWHGFLETGFAWRHVAMRLAEAGYAVLVPDMRGFGDSDKPGGVAGYDALSLAREFRALVASLRFGNGQPLTIAAHDMGAPPALLYAAHHPDEVKGMVHVEGPVMLADVLQKIIAYEPEAMSKGSMWWWILPLAPDIPERLIVGRERAFLTWFHETMLARRSAIDEATVDEYLRTFTGREGVLGAMGVYRAAFVSIEQTTPLRTMKVKVPVIALGGRKSLAEAEGDMIRSVAASSESHVLEDGGHFLPEECPDEVVRHIEDLATR